MFWKGFDRILANTEYLQIQSCEHCLIVALKRNLIQTVSLQLAHRASKPFALGHDVNHCTQDLVVGRVEAAHAMGHGDVRMGAFPKYERFQIAGQGTAAISGVIREAGDGIRFTEHADRYAKCFRDAHRIFQ